ncbi:MAG: zinc dependent phospholipase C family protein [Candidatus Thorarchaeota archaeon]|nr:MAG: zinc dependent phospholipase C family protein [Candidatus Thorarchaeota archaeon]
MKKSGFILTILLVSVIPAGILLPMATPASAWGLTTHMFIVGETADYISNLSWADAYDFYIPEVLSGSTAPDSAWQDWSNHLYYPIDGTHTAPSAAKTWFDYARDNFTSANWEDGFFAFGVLSHYVTDTCNPIHTYLNWTGHPAYEGDVNANLATLALSTPSEVIVTNASQLVVDNAVFVNQYYNIIVDAYPYSESTAIQTNATIRSITETCISRALNSTLSLFFTLTQGLDAPDVTVALEYVALFDFAHTNDYIDYAGEVKLVSVNQTLARRGFEMKRQESAFTASALADVDLLVVTCGLDEYTTDEITAISNWAATGNKSIIVTGRGDYSEYVDTARANDILEAVGSNIRVNDDNVNMEGTYQPYYIDLTEIPDEAETVGLTVGVASITFYSPSSLYFLDDGPVLPIIYADATGYQVNERPPAIIVVWDALQDGVNGEQIPLAAVEEVGSLRVLVTGTTFFSDFDYGKTAIFDNIVFLENFLDWAIDRDIGDIPDEDEIGPRMDIEWTPTSPDEGQNVAFTATVTDPSNVDHVTFEVFDGTTTTTATPTIVGDEYTIQLSDEYDGSVQVRVRANDTAGNEAVRGYFTVAWGDEVPTTTGTTTPTGPPLDDTTLYLMIAAAGGAMIVLALVFVVMRRR